MKPLKIRLLGGFTVAGAVAPVRPSRYGDGLIAYLAYHIGCPVSRDELIDLLWSVRDPKRSRHSLSQLLHSLKRTLPSESLIVSRAGVALAPDAATVDYQDFMAAALAGNHLAALDLYSGAFLGGLAYVSDSFDDWREEVSAASERTMLEICRAVLLNDATSPVVGAAVAARALEVCATDLTFIRARVEMLSQSGETDKAVGELIRLRADVPELEKALSELQAYLIDTQPEQQDQHEIMLPFVGRSKELATITRHWMLSRDSCRAVVLTGESGIGKTALLQHACRRLAVGGARIFLHTCRENESKLPYVTLTGLLQDWARESDIDHLDQHWHYAIGQLVPELVPPSVRRNYEATAPRTWEAAAQLFAGVAKRQPIVIAIDDYQWIDEASRDAVLHATRRLRQSASLFLIAGRSSVHFATYEDEREIASHFQLEQLRSDEIEQIFDSFMSRYNVFLSKEIRNAISAHVGGQPLLLTETLRYARQVDPSELTRSLPSSLRAHVQRMIRSLPPPTRAVLWAAATLGSDATLMSLARMTGLGAASVTLAAAEIADTGLVAAGEILSFRHDLIREAVVAEIPAIERRLWHARAADVLSGVDSGARLAAVHFEMAGDRERAYLSAKKASALAWRQRAFEEAEDQAMRMLRCASPSRRDLALRRLAKAASRLGHFDLLEPYIPEMEDMFLRRSYHEGIVICRIAGIRMAERQNLGFDPLLANVKDLLSYTSANSPDQLPTVLWYFGEYVRRSREYQVMRQFAATLVDMSQLARVEEAVHMLSLAAVMEGSATGYEAATPIAEDAVTRALQKSDPDLVLKALFARGTVNLWAGRIQAAGIDYANAVAAAADVSTEHKMQALKANFAITRMEQGRFDEAGELALEGLGGATTRVHSYANLALLGLRRGDLNAARHYTSAVLECHRRAPENWIPIHVEALLGAINLEEGDANSASRRAETVRNNIHHAEGVGDPSTLYLLPARCARLAGDRAGAAEWLRDAVRKTSAKDYIGGARLLLELASVLTDDGQPEEASAIVHPILNTALANGAVLLAREAEAVLSYIAEHSN
jgi:hypothetical protein